MQRCVRLPPNHDRPDITPTKGGRIWFMRTEAAQCGLPLQSLFMGISWDCNLWAIGRLWFFRYQRSFFQLVQALGVGGGSVFTNDLTWKGKMMPQTNTKRGKTSNVKLYGAGEHDIGGSDWRDKASAALWPVFVCCKNKEASKIWRHWQKCKQKADPGLRMMRQVLHEHFISWLPLVLQLFDRQPTNYFTLIVSQVEAAPGCQNSTIVSPHLLSYYKANRQVCADCCWEKKKAKISLAETFSSLPPSTHSYNRKCWLGYKSHVEDTR